MNKHKRERLRILRELDVDAAVMAFPDVAKVVVGGYNASGRYTDRNETLLAGPHRARLIWAKHFTDAELAESRQWLFDRGWRVSMEDA